MTSGRKNIEITGIQREECDIKVWSEACRRNDSDTEGERYLCSSCGKIAVLDHEMHHEHFPHLNGDSDNMS